MNKAQFIAALRERIDGLPQSDIERSVDYYSEMIDDRVEDGLSEEEAVTALGTMEEIVSQILSETPLSRIVKEKARIKRPLHAWEIVLIILGFPVWLPLILAALIILLAVYIVIWAVIVVFYAVDLSFAACALGGVATGILSVATGEPEQGLFLFGSGLVCAGIAILFFFVCDLAAKGVIALTKICARGIKKSFVGKVNNK